MIDTVWIYGSLDRSYVDVKDSTTIRNTCKHKSLRAAALPHSFTYAYSHKTCINVLVRYIAIVILLWNIIHFWINQSVRTVVANSDRTLNSQHLAARVPSSCNRAIVFFFCFFCRRLVVFFLKIGHNVLFLSYTLVRSLWRVHTVCGDLVNKVWTNLRRMDL